MGTGRLEAHAARLPAKANSAKLRILWPHGSFQSLIGPAGRLKSFGIR